MCDEMKSFMFLVIAFTVVVMSIAICTAYSNYLETTRFKECLSAGYEWVHVQNSTAQCRKVNK